MQEQVTGPQLESEQGYGKILKYCDKSFDDAFEDLMKSGHLQWKPWVGVDWKLSERRVLIVGESHYAGKEDADNKEERVKEWSNDHNSSRNVICEVCFEDKYTKYFFGNLHRAILGADIHGEKRVAFWRHLAFCNFIQRIMTDPKERPSPSEFHKGWQPFLKLLQLLRPDTVLFVGVTAAKYFDVAMEAIGVEHKIEYDKRLNRVYPPRFFVANDGVKTEMIAIRHTSQYFSWRTWHDYLLKWMPEDLEFLRGAISL